ncbi:hypothetical protein Bresa_02691|uniref:Uncharacterized protein n=1 Tax=Brenneria salicis ATCC 15712 = DSM 30166 TaxID=714314 RepID=A0A366IE68_9GAMM|nr:hypothetical protein [Brenneria salicis]NMN92406.1 hypothetical protein [Brenneria salicis ATCC 15712 = DSM 30166]RBP67748.1 hypothetical protein DES54_101270 [Brenneria salicis ATCC 15712 = DSM 30166]
MFKYLTSLFLLTAAFSSQATDTLLMLLKEDNVSNLIRAAVPIYLLAAHASHDV